DRLTLARSFAAKGQNAFLYQQESPAYQRRNGPPLRDAASRRSFAAARRNAFFSKKHRSVDRNRPPTSDGMARLSDTPSRGARSRPKAKSILLKKHSSIDGNCPLTGTA